MEVAARALPGAALESAIRNASTLSLGLLCALLLAAGCGGLSEPDPQQARDWHAQQWSALAAAWAAGQDELPVATRPPWGVGGAVPKAYAAVLASRAGETAAWDALEEDSRGQLRYCTELLAALYQRDAGQLGTLSAELAGRRSAQQAALDGYAAARAKTAAAVEALRAAWVERWPQQDLDFDLDSAVLAARGASGAPDAARLAQLRGYHSWNYERLQRRYLGWVQPAGASAAEPAGAVAEEPTEEAFAAPSGCTELRAALQALEAALVARNALETQAAIDAGVMQRYATEGVSAARLKYREPRLAVAQARLALFSRIDALLSPAEDVLQTQASREWRAVWPGCDVETNIYAYAGLPMRDSE